MIAFTIYTLLLASSYLANPVFDDEHLRKYVKDIQSKVDVTVKPCDNFAKYACGKVTMKDKPDMHKLIEEQIKNIDELPETEDLKLIKNLYLSCKNGDDIKKIFEQVDELKSVTWPITRDYNNQEIAELFGHLAALIVFELLNVSPWDLYNKNTIDIGLHSENSIDKQLLAKTLDKFGATSAQNVELVENMSHLAEQLKLENFITGDIDKFNNVEELKKAVPNFDWDSYFIVFTKEFNLDHDDFIKKPVVFEDLAKMLKIIEIITTTDSKTVANYLVWRYLSLDLNFICSELDDFLFPFLTVQHIKHVPDLKNFFIKEKKIFNIFQKSYYELKAESNIFDSKELDTKVKLLKNVYGNYENYLSGNYLTKLFNNFEINENTIYANVFNLLNLLCNDIIVSGEHGSISSFVYFINKPLKNFVSPDYTLHDCLLHNYVTNIMDFWTLVVENPDYYNNQAYDDCSLLEGTKIEGDLYAKNLNLHTGYRISLQEYLLFIDEPQFKGQTEILTEAGLTQSKAYMLALAQDQCKNYKIDNRIDRHTLNDDDHVDLLRFFKYSTHFSTIWGCTANDTMNKDPDLICGLLKMPN